MAAPSCLIPANPDVAGIGVRLSVYIQAASTLIPATLKMMEDQFREHTLPKNRRTMFYKTVVNWENILEVATPNISLGIALFISSIIQAHIYGLAVYHALILLNLHLIIGFSVAPYFILSGNDKNNPDSIKGINPAYGALAFLHTVHLCCAAGFGLWLFATIPNFDHASPNCTATTTYFVLGKKVAIASIAFRDSWIAIYSILVIPYFNAAILLVVSYGLYVVAVIPLLIPAFIIGIIIGFVSWCKPIKRSSTELVLPLATTFLVSLAPVALVVFLTEATVRINQVSNGENVWTFGQTIAILIAVLPLWRVFKQTKATISRIRHGDTDPGLPTLPTTHPVNNTYSPPSPQKSHGKLLR
ncbi:hypothetical protein BD410DRAFT_285402 [Rickenella mellea]|uniref:Uncharacterized protein n=1 Tax=Rickenella mellea TaxID=50990 RepID=A0A4Y7Q316_9AGAM|nr:hypothetical protein BD410DRAFT_285402 [Rickenella mellea]